MKKVTFREKVKFKSDYEDINVVSLFFLAAFTYGGFYSRFSFIAMLTDLYLGVCTTTHSPPEKDEVCTFGRSSSEDESFEEEKKKVGDALDVFEGGCRRWYTRGGGGEGGTRGC